MPQQHSFRLRLVLTALLCLAAAAVPRSAAAFAVEPPPPSFDGIIAYAQGHFLTTDPVLDVDPANPHTWNKYGFVRGNPIRFIDPDGRTTHYGSGDARFIREELVEAVRHPSGRRLFMGLVNSPTRFIYTTGALNSKETLDKVKRGLKVEGAKAGETWPPDGNTVVIVLDKDMHRALDSRAKPPAEAAGGHIVTHENFHACDADTSLDLFYSGDRPSSSTGVAARFAAATSNETSDISRQEAERIVDKALGPPPTGGN